MNMGHNRFKQTADMHLVDSVRFMCLLLQEASGAISGDGAFGKLKFESGIHRVQVRHLHYA